MAFSGLFPTQESNPGLLHCRHKNLELAQLFVEYALSAECQEAQNKDFGRRPIRSDVTPVGLEPLSSITLMNYNFDYAGANKAEIVEKWQDAVVGD